MKITVFYVGTSLLSALKRAEQEINARHNLALNVSTYNCGAPLSESEWRAVDSDLSSSDIVFIIHVTDSENSARIDKALDLHKSRPHAIIAFNCMPDLMRRTRLATLNFAALMKSRESTEAGCSARSIPGFAKKLSTWMGDFIKTSRSNGANRVSPGRNRPPANTDLYLKLMKRLTSILKFVPSTGKLKDVKNYLLLFAYFLQPTPSNIRAMLLLAVKQYVPGNRQKIVIDPPEEMPLIGIYHPDSDRLFETFSSYQEWSRVNRRPLLDPARTIGLLLMRPQIISDARLHYDGLIRSIEEAGLCVIPAISTFMDNREACRKYFVDDQPTKMSSQNKVPLADNDVDKSREGSNEGQNLKSRVSQVVSLTGFSFVGGPAMNDSQ